MELKNKKGFIIVCGPSGVGKSTLIERISQEMSRLLAVTVSYTTREKRYYEEDQKSYFFISKEEFLKKERQGEFIEYTQVYEHYYATSREQVEKQWSRGKSIIKDVDLKGLRSIKRIYPHSLAIGVFGPSIKEVQKRIQKRKSDSHHIVKIRKEAYHTEIKELERLAEVKIINDQLEKAYINLKKEIETYLSSI